MPTFPLCRHIRTNGLQCHAPALTDGVHCFFHSRLYRRHSGFYHNPAALPSGQQIQLAPLEDAESIQLAISVVVNALASGTLDTRRATAILYGLSLAAANARRVHVPYSDAIRAFEHTPDGLDLVTPNLPQPNPQNNPR
jgi:hypothetical protein